LPTGPALRLLCKRRARSRSASPFAAAGHGLDPAQDTEAASGGGQEGDRSADQEERGIDQNGLG